MINKKFLSLIIISSLPSCASLETAYKNIYISKQVDSSNPQSKLDSSEEDKSEFSPKPQVETNTPCKKTFDKALTKVDKELPLIGADLDGYTNLLAQYLNCEMVKRDDRIAEVLLKLLKRIDSLENEVSTLKGN